MVSTWETGMTGKEGSVIGPADTSVNIEASGRCVNCGVAKL
jgi:hypothetical protein